MSDLPFPPASPLVPSQALSGETASAAANAAVSSGAASTSPQTGQTDGVAPLWSAGVATNNSPPLPLPSLVGLPPVLDPAAPAKAIPPQFLPSNAATLFGTAQFPALAAALSPPAPVIAGVTTMTEKQTMKRMNNVREMNLEIRKTYWPDIKPEDLWLLEDKKRGGFAQVPRTLSIIMNLINDIIKRREGKAVPAGKTYLVLWLNVFSDGFLRIDDERDAAFAAGYEGERNVTTFRAHMRILQELGFIDFKEGHKNPSQYVLMLNPYKVVKRLFEDKQIPEKHYTALLERASAIGSAKELKE